MLRKEFIKNTSLYAIAVSATGFIRFDGLHYRGDCETTSDILGPFYRPGSPVRNNLLVSGEPGQLLELKGKIMHDDCLTPYPKAKIELWHCDSQGVYDNTSQDFLYRGTAYSDSNGNYSFDTILPPPYTVGAGQIRPAHFHLMITAEGYQQLITQLYFSGDPNIAKDKYASAAAAKKRILTVTNSGKSKKMVEYNISMSRRLKAEAAAIDKLTGIYTVENNKDITVEFFKENDALWMKNEVYGENFEYVGNNMFKYPGLPAGMYATLQFEIMTTGKVKVTYRFNDDDLVDHIYIAFKEN